MSEAFPLIGHTAASDKFERAKESGRLHHGWIFQGPSGIGKSIFARRIAGWMLGADAPSAAADDKTMQLILSGGHPDLKWVQRELNEKGKLRQDITVDQIRDLNKFFALRPAMAGWRVGVIDALDEMNVSGMNALLKTLEEPPTNALLILISHGTQPILPTIRSRCQVLRLYPLSDDDTKAVLKQQDGETTLAAELAQGRPGYGLELAQTGGAKAVQTAKAMLRNVRKPTGGVVSAALSAAVVDEGALRAFEDTLLAWVAEKAESDAGLSSTWLAMHEVRATAEELNLTPLQTATKLFATLQDGVKAVSA
ncbi:MAG: DNA polymerase III subunit delta' [Pseudomonadota bacterium]|nr:DNA polymerase III subunit delta' [Pseudomonadota bacterium]